MYHGVLDEVAVRLGAPGGRLRSPHAARPREIAARLIGPSGSDGLELGVEVGLFDLEVEVVGQSFER